MSLVRNAEGKKYFKLSKSFLICILQCSCTLARHSASHLMLEAGGSGVGYKAHSLWSLSIGVHGHLRAVCWQQRYNELTMFFLKELDMILG